MNSSIEIRESNTMNNPTIVNEAITKDPLEVGSLTIHPITIYRYSLLERLQSPFLDASVPLTIDNCAASIFVLANEKSVLKKYANDLALLKETALDFIDDKLTMQDLPSIFTTIVNAFN